MEDECHCLDLELANRNITHPDDTTTFATYASSLHQRASLQEEKDSLSKLIATIKHIITYVALNLPNSQQNPGLQAACQLVSCPARKKRRKNPSGNTAHYS